MRASRILPEFSGFEGRAYPGQLKPQYQNPEPRVQLSKFSLARTQNGLKRSDDNNPGPDVKPRQLIFVKPKLV